MKTNQCVIGIDLGGTKIDLGLINPENKIVKRFIMPTNPDDGPALAVERIKDCVIKFQSSLTGDERIESVGICCPGPLDHEAGILINPTNLPKFFNVNLRHLLEDALNLPVSLEHDAKAAALGEYYFGIGRGEPGMVYTVIGTGVGSAIILDGKLIRGTHNFAGEIGHTTLDRYGEPCPCGSRGCLDTYISGPWLAERYKRLSGGQEYVDGEKITGKLVAIKAGKGDVLAKDIITQAGEAIGIAVATMAMTLGIELFVFGGSVSKCGDILFDPARKIAPQYSFKSVGPRIRITTTQLGDDGALLGCGWLARQILEGN